MNHLPWRPFIALLILASLVTASVTCGAEVHAVSGNDSASLLQSHHPEGSPCCPAEHGTDTTHCDSCLSCPCHAPLTVDPFQLGYNPIMLNLITSVPFKHLPEVYLSKFIPPQIQA
jgi:hypothetical protein